MTAAVGLPAGRQILTINAPMDHQQDQGEPEERYSIKPLVSLLPDSGIQMDWVALVAGSLERKANHAIRFAESTA